MQTLINNALRMIQAERTHYLALRPSSVALSKQASQHFLYGVPMH